jgi:hypothetical protein
MGIAVADALQSSSDCRVLSVGYRYYAQLVMVHLGALHRSRSSGIEDNYTVGLNETTTFSSAVQQQRGCGLKPGSGVGLL